MGGMARVFLATLRGAGGFEKKLVVKQIRAELATDDAFVRRFVAEAKTTVELSHPNIVPVYELGVKQGVYYLAMELCAGVTLAELIQKAGKLTPEEGAYVGIEICRALDYAHRKARIIHRDVTLRNAIIDEEGAVRIIDFGIAAPAFAGAKEVFGSPGHMPPEQIAGGEVGPPTDVFAVAALLYEAWTKIAPFLRATPEEPAHDGSTRRMNGGEGSWSTGRGQAAQSAKPKSARGGRYAGVAAAGAVLVAAIAGSRAFRSTEGPVGSATSAATMTTPTTPP